MGVVETIACMVCGKVHAFNAACCPEVLQPPKLRPIGARVLVKPDPPPTRSTILETVEYGTPPETSGTVVALGRRFVCEQCQASRPARVTLGDRIVFPPTVGQDVRLGERAYIILDEHDVLAVVGPEGAR